MSQTPNIAERPSPPATSVAIESKGEVAAPLAPEMQEKIFSAFRELVTAKVEAQAAQLQMAQKEIVELRRTSQQEVRDLKEQIAILGAKVDVQSERLNRFERLFEKAQVDVQFERLNRFEKQLQKAQSEMTEQRELVATYRQDKIAILTFALYARDIDLALNLIQTCKREEIDTLDGSGRNVLHHATITGLAEIVQALLEKGANVKQPTSQGLQPLHLAAAHGHKFLIKFFLGVPDVGVDEKDESEWTALHHASSQGHIKIVELLHTRRANVNLPTPAGLFPIHLAAQKGHIPIVKFYLNCHVDVNKKDADGDDFWTALHFAVQAEDANMVRFLLSNETDVNGQKKEGKTPLHLAVRANSCEIASILLAAGADPKIKTEKGKTARDLAKGPKMTSLLEQYQK